MHPPFDQMAAIFEIAALSRRLKLGTEKYSSPGGIAFGR
jgi:hypothetical protein